MATGKTPCGIAIPQTSAPADVRFLRDYLTRAEALGYDSVWVQEQILGDAPMLDQHVAPAQIRNALVHGDDHPGLDQRACHRARH